MSATHLSYCSVGLHIWYTSEMSYYLKHLCERKKNTRISNFFEAFLIRARRGSPSQKRKSAKILRMQQIPPGKLPIPSENYCSRPLVDFGDADGIPTTPEAPRFGKPSVLEHSPAKFDRNLPNFAGFWRFWSGRRGQAPSASETG